MKKQKKVTHEEEVEYAFKEFLHGILIGLIVGFGLAFMLLR